MSSLLQLLGDVSGCIAIIGAGGKTTTMLALGDALAESGRRVLLTTSTRIWPPPHRRLILVDQTSQLDAALRLAFQSSHVAVLGRRIGPEGKLYGVAPDLVCDLAAGGSADVVLCEADGAAGRSLKVHGPGEPVVPACTGELLVLAGIDVVGQPADARVIHRLPEFLRLTGLSEGACVTADHVAVALRAAAQHAPPGARIVYVLNKADDEAGRAVAQVIALACGKIDRRSEVVAVSRGQVALG